MCFSICYQFNQRIIITNFAQTNAQIPIERSNGIKTLFPWGRRRQEQGQLPLGGWAPIEILEQDKWAEFFPKSVKLPICKFQEINSKGQGLWFDITDGQWIQGVYLHEQNERRVYVVTLKPDVKNSHYSRWPMIGIGANA